MVNFWRSPKWVIAANAKLVYDHSIKGRERRRNYNKSEKGRARNKVYEKNLARVQRQLFYHMSRRTTQRILENKI